MHDRSRHLIFKLFLIPFRVFIYVLSRAQSLKRLRNMSTIIDLTELKSLRNENMSMAIKLDSN